MTWYDRSASDQWQSSFHEKFRCFKKIQFICEQKFQQTLRVNLPMKPNLLGFSFPIFKLLVVWNTFPTPRRNLKCLSSIFRLEIYHSKLSTPPPPQANLTAGQQCQTSCLKDDVHVENQPQTMRQTERMLIERSLEVQTSDNMERWKAEQGSRVRRKSRAGKWSQKKVSWKTEYICANVSKKKIQVCEVWGKSQIVVFSQWFVVPVGRKVGSLKRRVRSQVVRGEIKNCTPLRQEVPFQVKMSKTLQRRTAFGSSDVERGHAAVPQSTFASQNVQNTPWLDNFLKFKCRKMSRRCGAKHMCKSKCEKKKEVRSTFQSSVVEKLHAVVARSTFTTQNLQNTCVFGRLFEVSMSHRLVSQLVSLSIVCPWVSQSYVCSLVSYSISQFTSEPVSHLVVSRKLVVACQFVAPQLVTRQLVRYQVTQWVS